MRTSAFSGIYGPFPAQRREGRVTPRSEVALPVYVCQGLASTRTEDFHQRDAANVTGSVGFQLIFSYL